MNGVSSLFGSNLLPSRRWAPFIEVSPQNHGMVSAEELAADPFLPVLAVDPFDPAGGIVIPAGRFVSIGYTNGRGSSNYRFAYTDTGYTTLTLHDGQNLTPVGMSVNQMYKSANGVNTFMTDSGMSGSTIKYRRGFVCEVPHVLAVNNAHGALSAGDRVTGYWGTTTSTSTIGYIHRGKPVKWNGRKLYCQNSTASSTIVLSAAVYPGYTPTLVAAMANGTNLINAVCAFSFNGTNWVASFTGTGSGTVTDVFYLYGQPEDQIAGEVLRLQSLSDILSRDNYLKWVEYAPQDYLNFPPAQKLYPVTQVTDETPTTVVANSQYRVLNYPLSVHYPVTVQVSNATVVDAQGNASSYATGTWFTLPTTMLLDQKGYFVGLYHDVNWLTGLIELGGNITPISGNIQIQVSYSYITDPKTGSKIWGAGIENLTDGRYVNTLGSTPAYGVPAHLNLSDVVAAMRIIVRA